MQHKFIAHDPPRRYSKAAVYGSFIFLAGEDSKDPQTQRVRGTTAAEQAEYLFQNMRATLESLGSGLEHVIKTTIYLTDARHADGYREGRKKYLPHAPPSTLIMGVQLADPAMLLEIEAVAVIPDKKR
jgi:enamine deaminase RidA (YjgF/YER057c/UK114 family)